jgi:metacaspase-1
MKRALLIGINYAGTSHALRGCINDIRLMNRILIDKFGFLSENIVILEEQAATCDAIKSNLEKIVRESESGDQIYVHYSGHGSQIPVRSMEFVEFAEPDALEEIIIGYDHNWADKMVLDNDFARILSVLDSNENIECLVVLDCCHSGDGLRSFPPRGPETGGFFSKESILDSRNRSIPIEGGVVFNREFLIDYGRMRGILISGCRSNETSADAFINGRYQGALTFGIASLLEQFPSITYEEMVKRLNGLLGQIGFTQQPELNCAEIYRDRKFLGGYRDESF